MKTSNVGIVAAAILMVVAGVGFGIAQAGGTHPIGEFLEWQTLEQGSSSSSYVETRPVLAFEDSSSPYAETRPVLSFEDQEIPQMAKSPADDMQLENPIETGSLPVENNSDSSVVETEGNMYRSGVDTGAP